MDVSSQLISRSVQGAQGDWMGVMSPFFWLQLRNLSQLVSAGFRAEATDHSFWKPCLNIWPVVKTSSCFFRWRLLQLNGIGRSKLFSCVVYLSLAIHHSHQVLLISDVFVFIYGVVFHIDWRWKNFVGNKRFCIYLEETDVTCANSDADSLEKATFWKAKCGEIAARCFLELQMLQSWVVGKLLPYWSYSSVANCMVSLSCQKNNKLKRSSISLAWDGNTRKNKQDGNLEPEAFS